MYCKSANWYQHFVCVLLHLAGPFYTYCHIETLDLDGGKFEFLVPMFTVNRSNPFDSSCQYVSRKRLTPTKCEMSVNIRSFFAICILCLTHNRIKWKNCAGVFLLLNCLDKRFFDEYLSNCETVKKGTIWLPKLNTIT